MIECDCGAVFVEGMRRHTQSCALNGRDLPEPTMYRPDCMTGPPVEDEERGVCMNCGADMDYSPMHPWCPDCSEEG